MFYLQFQPRFGESDACGHINNTVLPQWMEAGRTPILRIFSPDFNYKTWNTIVAHIEVDFTAQIFLGPEVNIKSFISRIGNSSFEIYQEVWQTDKLCAKCKTVIIHFDFKTQKSMPIPEDIRKQLETHLLP